MKKMSLRGNKGISGSISAMFIIAIFFIILLTIFAITSALNSYNQTVLERNKMDWERDSEHITFIAAEVGENGKLNVSFSNDGGVTLHLVQVWFAEFPNEEYTDSTWQYQYWISRYVSSGETVNDLGYHSEFRKIGVSSMGALTSLSGFSSSLYYKIRLVTERGNVFECQVPYPPSTSGEGGSSGGYVLQIENEEGSFQYVYNEMTDWTQAFVKNGHKNAPLMYRVLVLNTAKKDVELLSQTFMQQMGAGQVGQEGRFFICEPPSDEDGNLEHGVAYLPLNPTIWWSGPKPPTPPPPAFISQTIPAGQSRYVYFAIKPDATGDSPSTIWQTDPNYSSNQPVYVSCMLYFNFVGDPEVRNVPTPAILQLLNYPT